MGRRNRECIFKEFYVNRFTANKAVAVMYLEEELDDFFERYSFDSKGIKDYDHATMRKHIVFDLCRILGDAGFRLFELLCDYTDDLYNRAETMACAKAAFDNIKLSNVN